MKDFLVFLPITVLYLVIKSTLFTSFPLPDLPLLMVFYVGHKKPAVEGALLSFALGYIEDAFTGGIYGVTSFSLVLIFLATHLLAKKVQFTTPAITAGCAFAMSLLKGVLIYSLLGFMGLDAPFLWRIIVQALLTGIFASAVISAFHRIGTVTGQRTFER